MGIKIAAVATGILSALGHRFRRRRTNRNSFHSQYRVCSGLRVHFRRSQPKPNRLPIVLVHGLGISGTYWLPTANLLANEREIYIPDLPGHGRSARSRHPMNIADLADSLLEWMDETGIEKAILIGNSMGCQICIEAALKRTEKIERLILIGPTVDPTIATLPQHLVRFIAAAPFERLSIAWILLVDYLRAPDVFFNEIFAMFNYSTLDKLILLSTPTCFVRGQHDPLVSRRWLEAARRITSPGEVVEVKHWGHAVHYSAPVEFTESITEFLEHSTSSQGTRSHATLKKVDR